MRFAILLSIAAAVGVAWLFDADRPVPRQSDTSALEARIAVLEAERAVSVAAPATPPAPMPVTTQVSRAPTERRPAEPSHEPPPTPEQAEAAERETLHRLGVAFDAEPAGGERAEALEATLLAQLEDAELGDIAEVEHVECRSTRCILDLRYDEDELERRVGEVVDRWLLKGVRCGFHFPGSALMERDGYGFAYQRVYLVCPT